MTSHWTYELFVLRADLYAKTLEPMIKRAESEVEGLVKIFSKHEVPSGGKILDLCCGMGRHCVFLAKKGYDVVGIDFSSFLIERAKKLAQDMRVESKLGP